MNVTHHTPSQPGPSAGQLAHWGSTRAVPSVASGSVAAVSGGGAASRPVGSPELPVLAATCHSLAAAQHISLSGASLADETHTLSLGLTCKAFCWARRACCCLIRRMNLRQASWITRAALVFCRYRLTRSLSLWTSSLCTPGCKNKIHVSIILTTT